MPIRDIGPLKVARFGGTRHIHVRSGNRGNAITTVDNETQLKLKALAALPDPIFILTESGRYAAIIGGQDRSLYHDASCLVDFSLYDVLARDKAEWFLDEIRTTLAEDRLRVVEYGLAASDVDGLDTQDGPDGELWFEGRVQPMGIPVNGERAVLWLASNITRRHALEVRLRELSETDELTGVGNRRRLMETLNQLLHDYDPTRSAIALLILDIDHFKSINDRYGHLQGDRVIKTITDACHARIKARDLLARLGGEEFAIVLADTTARQAVMVAERLRTTIAEHAFELGSGDAMHVTISVGVSVAEPRLRRTYDLLRHADTALYLAKSRGRNRVVLANSDTDVPNSVRA